MTEPAFPIITLEISGMKHAIKAAFTQYLMDLDSDIQAAIEAHTSSDNIRRVIDTEVSLAIDTAIKEEIQHYFRYGDGRKIIKDAVARKLEEE